MKKIGFLAMTILFNACVSIPKETVILSQTLGSDLQVLHTTHRNMVFIHFKNIEEDITSFVDDVYAPFIISYVLKNELKKYQDGGPSLYTTIENAGKKEGKEESENALKEMYDFLNAARLQIESKKGELLSPVILQETNILKSVDQSYENALYANATLTAYLQSIKKVKTAQQEALSRIGLNGVDSLISNTLVNLSDQVNAAVKKGKDIDIHSEEAFKNLEAIMEEIKQLTNNK